MDITNIETAVKSTTKSLELYTFKYSRWEAYPNKLLLLFLHENIRCAILIRRFLTRHFYLLTETIQNRLILKKQQGVSSDVHLHTLRKQT